MFSLDTTLGSPIVVTINGTKYNIPRFLLPAIKQWAVDRRAEVTAEATSHLAPDEKARFLMYFQAAPVDVFQLDEWSRSPEGSESIIRRQFAAGGVPVDLIDQAIERSEPLILAQIAYTLASSSRALKQVSDEKAGQTPDPLAEPSPGADDSHLTGTSNSAKSSTSSPA